MKALLLTPDFPPMVGGIATVLGHWAKELGPELLTMAPREPGSGEWDSRSKLEVIRFDFDRHGSGLKKSFQHLVLARKVARVAREARVEVTLAGILSPMARPLASLKRTECIPYVVATYGADIPEAGKTDAKSRLVLKLLRSADRVIAPSSYTMERLVARGVERGWISVVYPGVDPSEFPENPPAIQETRSRYGLTGKRVLLTVCRLEEHKGIDKVIEALPAVAGEFPDVVYVVVGAGKDEPGIRALPPRYGIQDRVIFAGRIPPGPPLAAFYHASELFVMASRDVPQKGSVEGFGIAYLEAAVCGKPAIAGRSGGTAEAVMDGETGIIVDPISPAAIAGAITKLLRDKALARRLGEQGRKRAVQEFSWKDKAHEVREVLSSAVLENRGAIRGARGLDKSSPYKSTMNRPG